MTIIYDTPAAAMRRLMEIGVPLEALQRAVHSGHVARITCTDNDPPQSPGTDAWRYTVRTIRDELCSRGWRKTDPNNFSLTINDARQINIVVESGDALTRQKHGVPKTKSLKGLYVEAATMRNTLEGDLFPETVADDLRRVAAILEYPTWIFLIYITDEEYRAELSLPVAMEGEQITDWSERIFVPDPEEPFGIRSGKPDVGDQGPDIDVPVRRRG
jgi:hypothetical protein